MSRGEQTRPRRPLADARRTPPPPRRAPARPRHRATRVLLTVGVAFSVLALGGQWLVHRPFLSVQHVTVLGAAHESTAQVIAASGLAAHPAMIDVSAHQVAENLSGFPWIARVAVVRHWPDSVTVTVTETTPVAVAYDATKVLQYVNAQGRDLGPAPASANLPTLEYGRGTGFSWPYARAGRAAAVVAAALPPAFSAQVARVSVSASGDVTLSLTTPVSFELGPATNLTAKFRAVASVIKAAADGQMLLKAGDVFDVTVPDEVSVTGPTPS